MKLEAILNHNNYNVTIELSIYGTSEKTIRMFEINIEVQNDHLEKITRSLGPVQSLSELIWNSLDADASEVFVNFKRNDLNGIDFITITDNGHGILFDTAREAFKNLGGSEKAHGGKTPGGRNFHGKQGKGRFKAYALGNTVQWATTFFKDNKTFSYQISGSVMDLRKFKISDLTEIKGAQQGTKLIVGDINKNFPILDQEKAFLDLLQEFALYIKQYNVKIWYKEKCLNPALLEKNTATEKIFFTSEAETFELELLIVEWNTSVERIIYLCDENGFALSQINPGIQAPGFNFTAYAKCKKFRELFETGDIESKELNPIVRDAVKEVRKGLKDYFRKRSSEQSSELVSRLKFEKLYPYEGEPQTPVESVERQIFDVLTLNLHDYMPDFEDASAKNKRFTLRLLKESLENNPTSLTRILQEVLELPLEKQDDLASLLEKTSLESIINASKLVSDRLDFLKGLETILYEPDIKKVLKERSQLHKILANGQTWVFGEKYHLCVSDQSLKAVLKKHFQLLKKTGLDLEDEQAIEVPGKKKGIVDLMLSRMLAPIGMNLREHLIVELKRPTEKITLDEIGV